jgi:large subunit ribosomal protein L15
MAHNILSNLRPAKGSRKRVKRIGRGQGSGHGGTATRGHKGAKSRSGFTFKYWFEGGQMPLTRRVPKFGFKSRSREEFQIVNIKTIEHFIAQKRISGDVVSPEVLYEIGAISNKQRRVKILGEGDLKSKVDVRAHAFSKSAISKIEAAGGKAIVLG